MIAAMSGMSAAFADSGNAAATQQQQTANTGPYDSPDFVVPPNNVYP